MECLLKRGIECVVVVEGLTLYREQAVDGGDLCCCNSTGNFFAVQRHFPWLGGTLWRIRILVLAHSPSPEPQHLVCDLESRVYPDYERRGKIHDPNFSAFSSIIIHFSPQSHSIHIRTRTPGR
jgi:hypothetical protein